MKIIHENKIKKNIAEINGHLLNRSVLIFLIKFNELMCLFNLLIMFVVNFKTRKYVLLY